MKWMPSTCPCVITVEYDRERPDETFTGVNVKACAQHADLTAHQVYLAVLASQRAGSV
jgi:hypothetical protein